MRDVLKDASVSSILIAIVGLVLLLMPSLTNRIIVYGIGGVLAVYGIGRIFRYIRRSADAGSRACLCGIRTVHDPVLPGGDQCASVPVWTVTDLRRRHVHTGRL